MALVHLEPAALPVVRVLFPEAEYVVDAGAELGPFRNGLDGLADHGRDVVTDIGQRIHRRREDAAVPAVTVVHDVADPVGDGGRRVGHAGGQHPDKVRLDLEIDVVGVGIVLPVAGGRCRNPVQDVVAGCLVGVPEFIGRVREGVGKVLHRGVDPLLGHHLQEGQVHIDIVVEAGIFNKGIIDVIVVPDDRHFVGHQAALELELGGAAVGAADGLGEPAALDLVGQRRLVDRHGASVGNRGLAARYSRNQRGCGQGQCQYSFHG